MTSSDAQNLKPIETSYKGYKFRSRKEARYAVFFDALGIEWEYEPEGFDLGDGDYYLPDFLIKNNFDKLWVEVKSIKPTEDEVLKATKLQQQSGNRIVIVWDTLEPRHFEESVRSFKSIYFLTDEFNVFRTISDKGFAFIHTFSNTLDVWSAYEKARSARFEKRRKRRKKRFGVKNE